MNYLKFNQELDEYLDSHKYSFYLYTLKSNIEFLKEAKKRLDPFKIIGSNKLCLECNQFVDGMETLDLVSEFLNSIDKRYTYYFERSLNDGSFGFCDSINDTKDFSNNAYISNNRNLYNVAFNGNIADGKTLIHEFFHYLNLDSYLASPVFSELISIYMENKYLDFIYEKGYSKNDIAVSRLFRYLSYNYSCNKLYNDSILLNIKDKIGYIDEDSYQFIIDYREELDFPNMTKDEYLFILHTLVNDINGFDKNNPRKNIRFRPDFIYRYFIGTAYSSYLLKEEDSLKDVLLLNDSLIYDKKLPILKCVELLGIDEVNFDEVIKATNEYYRPSIITYKLENKIKKLTK